MIGCRKHTLLLAVLALLVLAASCGGQAAQEDGEPSRAPSTAEKQSTGPAAPEGMGWGEGDYGVVLAHGAAYDAGSWEAQGEKLAENGFAAYAVEDLSAESVLAAAEYLEQEKGAERVALIGASAGSGPVLKAAEESPEDVDQLILLSGSGDVAGLGEMPKLFVASEGEGMADQARQMARQAPGDNNEALVVGGDAHAQAIFDTGEGDRLMQAILDRLGERRG